MRFRSWLAAALAFPTAALAEPVVDAVSAGDPDQTSAVLWVRATDNGAEAALRLQIATDPAFATIAAEREARTARDDDFTAKTVVDGLRPGTRYYYRFCAAACDPRAAGRFSTAPAPDARAALRFAFTGDADGRFRPYPAARPIPGHDLDFFVFLGDAIYETRAAGSAAVAEAKPRDGAAEARQVLTDYWRKYRENIRGVGPGGEPSAEGVQSLRDLLRATGHFTLLDNHELGSRDLQSGGAPPLARGFNAEPDYDANETGLFDNKTLGFRALEKAFYDHHATRAGIAGTPEAGLRPVGAVVDAPGDPRTHATPKNWFARRWGAHAAYIQTDARTYRDARLGSAGGGEDTGPRADNPKRTMLGRTQMAWLKAELSAAQRDGVAWKFVAVSSPIDEAGGPVPVQGSRWPAPGTQSQDGKSWFGGYRAERDELLGHIAAESIRGVVFLTTDDHFVRVTTLRYRNAAGAMAPVPGAFQIVSGPIGAGGPDAFPGHDCARVREALDLRNSTLRRMGQPENGLPADWPGLSISHRRCGAPGPAESLDFFVPDRFAYTVVEVSADGVLSVDTYGMDANKENAFDQDPAPVERTAGFGIDPRGGAR
jgi:phosphodiesterase/alkaline phosphatase D-like protein